MIFSKKTFLIGVVLGLIFQSSFLLAQVIINEPAKKSEITIITADEFEEYDLLNKILDQNLFLKNYTKFVRGPYELSGHWWITVYLTNDKNVWDKGWEGGGHKIKLAPISVVKKEVVEKNIQIFFEEIKSEHFKIINRLEDKHPGQLGLVMNATVGVGFNNLWGTGVVTFKEKLRDNLFRYKILTADHVVKITGPHVVLPIADDLPKVKIIDRYPKKDLAMLQLITSIDLPSVPLFQNSKMSVRDLDAVVIGFPEGSQAFNPVISYGTIKGENFLNEKVNFTCPVTYGDSGAGVFVYNEQKERWELISICTSGPILWMSGGSGVPCRSVQNFINNSPYLVPEETLADKLKKGFRSFTYPFTLILPKSN